MAEQNDVEEIIKLINKGFDIELIAFELDIPIERIKQYELEAEKRKNQAKGVKKYQAKEIIYNENKRAHSRMQQMREKYQTLLGKEDIKEEIKESLLIKDEEFVKEIIMEIESKIEEIKQASEKDTKNRVNCILKNLKKELQDQLDLEKVQIVIEQDINNLEILKANINNWDKAFTTFQTMTFEKWPRINANNEFKEEAKEIRDSVKKKFKAKLEKILLSDSKQSNLDIYDMYKILKKLQNLILEFKLQFSKKKQEKNIVDFSDIEHFALEILLKEDDNNNLVKTDVDKRYQEKFITICILISILYRMPSSI